MKTVRILGIIVILALIGGALKDAIPGFIDGWNDADRDFRPSGTHQRRERFNHINKHFRSACLLALKSNIYFIASFSTTETPIEDIFNGKRRYIRLRRHVNRL